MEDSPSPPPTRSAYGWMALSAGLFATMNFFARLVGEGGKVHWAHVGATRAAIGALVAFTIARARGTSLRARNPRGMWARSALGTASMLFTFYALSRRGLPLGDTTTLLNLTPVFLAFLSPRFLGERASPRLFLAIVVSLAGVLILLRPRALFGHEGAHEGALVCGAAATMAAVFAAFAMMMLRKIGKTEAPEAIALHFSLFATVTLLVVSLPSLALHPLVPAPKDALYMVLAGLAAGVAQLFMTRAYSLERAAHVSAVGYLAVVVSAGLGALALHEWPTASALVGMVLVVSGGLVVVLGPPAPAPAAEATPKLRA